MNVKLKLIGSKHNGKVIEVRGERFIIGRGEECHLRPSSEAVSRRHCALIMQRNRVQLFDLKSSNGTFVNGVRVKGEQALQSGDLVKVGPLEFAVQIAATPIETVSASKSGTRNSDISGFDTADESKQVDFIQQWLTDAPQSASSRDTIDDKLADTSASDIEHPQSTEPVADDHAPAKFVAVGVSRIPKDKLVGIKKKPMKLPKPEPVNLPNPADCITTSEAAKAAITGFLVKREQDNREA